MILVVAEQKDGVLNRSSWETLVAAQQFAGGATPIKVAVLGPGSPAVATMLAGALVDEVLTVDGPALAVYTPDAYVQAVEQVLTQESPQHVLFAHTYQARDFTPALAARLDRPLITDVIALRQAQQPVFTRPMFQGKLVADVIAEGPPPHLVTIQIGAFRADALERGAAPVSVRQVSVELDVATIRQQPEPPFQEAKGAVDLSQAERIVAVGRGIKQQENLAVAQTLAEAFGAELAASRPICDNGWLPMERQIGSSGQTVAPKLYVALGISGAIQHLVGMKGARVIVAINKDVDAPIFEVADYGIAGDIFELAPALIAELKK